MSYYLDIQHEGLKKFRRVSGSDPYVVEQKARAQMAQWEDQWSRKLAQQARAEAAREKEEKKALAAMQTREAQELLAEIDSLLAATLSVNDQVDWDDLKDHTAFAKARPLPPSEPLIPPAPRAEDAEFQPRLGLMDTLVRKLREQRITEAQARFAEAYHQWEDRVKQLKELHQRAQVSCQKAVDDWEAERGEFELAREKRNDLVDHRRAQYEAKDTGAISDYCDLVLSKSKYPDFFPQDIELDFNPENGLMIVVTPCRRQL